MASRPVIPLRGPVGGSGPGRYVVPLIGVVKAEGVSSAELEMPVTDIAFAAQVPIVSTSVIIPVGVTDIVVGAYPPIIAIGSANFVPVATILLETPLPFLFVGFEGIADLAVFVSSEGVPQEGLAPTVSIWEMISGNQTTTDAAMTEIAGGFYTYRYRWWHDETAHVVRADAGLTVDTSERYHYGAFSSTVALALQPGQHVGTSVTQTADLTMVKDILEADEVLSPSTATKKHKTTKAILVQKTVTGGDLTQTVTMTE